MINKFISKSFDNFQKKKNFFFTVLSDDFISDFLV